jgi:hypothetical protein
MKNRPRLRRSLGGLFHKPLGVVAATQTTLQSLTVATAALRRRAKRFGVSTPHDPPIPHSIHTPAGLDTAYPYPAVTVAGVAVDAPALQLVSTFTTESRSLTAAMWLLWTSSLTSSIPVPLGYQTWQFSGSVTQSGGTWGMPSGSGGPTSPNFTAASGSITANTSHPSWSGSVGTCQ